MQFLNKQRRKQQVERLSEQGNRYMEAQKYKEALNCFCGALPLLDAEGPLESQESATWLLVAIGDVLFHLKSWTKAVDALTHAMHCPGGLGNPFIHLRLGQGQFELNHLDRAADALTRAYMGAGEEIFEGEEPKYFDFLKSRITLPG